MSVHIALRGNIKCFNQGSTIKIDKKQSYTNLIQHSKLKIKKNPHPFSGMRIFRIQSLEFKITLRASFSCC